MTCRRLLFVLFLGLVGCGSRDPSASPTRSLVAEPLAFDVAAVRLNFTAECKNPIVVDDLFCEQVRISDMFAEGTILNVPTNLNAAAKDRAGAICEQVATAHHDGNGKDLGYVTIGVLDKDGAFMASCPLD